MTQADPRPASALDRVKSLSLYPLPQHGISRLVHRAARLRVPFWRRRLTRWFIARFGVDMSEAEQPDPDRYPDFNQFFTRALRPGARPLPERPDALACPADGTVSALGQASGDTLIQAKGRQFSLLELLGGDPKLARTFEDGPFLTAYLSPRDYHRVHLPLAGTLHTMLHVPGRLFSVAPFTVRAVPRLFARNERVVCLFDGAAGPMAMVLVGAICVGSIETVWHGEVTPPRSRRLMRRDYPPGQVVLPTGAEMGRFNMGSTVILLFGAGRVAWDPALAPGQRLRMGQEIGRLAARDS